MQFGKTTNVLMARGEELHCRRMKIDFRNKTDQNNRETIDLCKISLSRAVICI
jgi:hypothetical protein